MNPQRIRLSRAKGWRLPENAVHVGRPSRWGNPFVTGMHGTRAECAAKFYVLVVGGFVAFSEPELEPAVQLAVHDRVKRSLRNLAGKDLACWCPLDGGACHADVLLLLANRDTGLPVPNWMMQPVALPRVRLGMSVSDLRKINRAPSAQRA